MEIYKNKYHRYDINLIKDRFLKRGRKIGGIAGYAKLWGAILTFFGFAIRIKDDQQKTFYLNRKSAIHWINRYRAEPLGETTRAKKVVEQLLRITKPVPLADQAREVNSLTQEIHDSPTPQIVAKIDQKFSDRLYRRQLKENLFSISLANPKNDLAMALENLSLALQDTATEEAKACAEKVLKILPPLRPEIPFDPYYEIVSHLPTKDARRLAQVSLEDNKMAKQALVKRINQEKIPLGECGFKSLTETINFFGELAQEITYLDLNPWQVSDEDCLLLKESFPKATHLSIHSHKITDRALFYLKELKLIEVNFSECQKLIDEALLHLEGMPLTKVNFSQCRHLTNNVLLPLVGMKLTEVNFEGCWKLTDAALSHLKSMPLTKVNFSWCQRLTDAALSHLKGMPLTEVDFSGCQQLTDAALLHLKGMPLTNVNFSWCRKLTDEAPSHLKGMPLTKVNFWRW